MKSQNCNQAYQGSRRSQPLRLEHRSPPERLAISSAIYTAGLAKICAAPGDVIRSPSHFGNGRIRGETATERYQTESLGTAFPPPCSAPSALFFSKLAPYIG